MRFLIDQMIPHATCVRLTALGHDAVHVRDRGVDARPDPEVAAVAVAERDCHGDIDLFGVHSPELRPLLPGPGR